MPGIGIITNPNSRQNRKNPKILDELRGILGHHGTLYATRDRAELTEALRDLRARQVDVLAINGGDGTNHITMTAAYEVWGAEPMPAVALLRGGTMNTTATGLGISGNPRSILAHLVKHTAGGEPHPTREVDILKVGSGYGFLFGTGAPANFLEAYYEGGDASPVKAVQVLARSVGSALVSGPFIQQVFERSRARVEVDGKSWPIEEFDSITAGMVPDTGLGFRPYYRAGEKPGWFHLLGIACGPLELSLRLGRIFRARPIDHPQVLDQLAQQAVIHADMIKYQIDGDVYHTPGPLTLSVGGRLRVVTT